MDDRIRVGFIDFESTGLNAPQAVSVGIIVVGGNDDNEIIRYQSRVRTTKPNEPSAYKIHRLDNPQDPYIPSPKEVLAVLRPIAESVKFMVAHNAAYDGAVMNKMATDAMEPFIDTPLLCSLEQLRGTTVLRDNKGLKNLKLDTLARWLKVGKQADVHGALSDAILLKDVYLELLARRII